MMNIPQLVTQIVFYVFALGAILSALIVVTAKNPVKGVLALVLTFVAMAGIWVLLHAEFLALILVVVYVGAVMTLFLFVVMMLNLNPNELKRHVVRYLPFGLLVLFFVLAVIYLALNAKNIGLATYALPVSTSVGSNVEELGMTLFTQYEYAFEIAGVLLLVAMISAIALAFRGPRYRRVISVRDQLEVKASERLTIVKMQADIQKEQEPHS